MISNIIRKEKDKIQNFALEQWKEHRYVGTLHLYTGAGKTFCFFKSLYMLFPPKSYNFTIYFLSESSAREFDVRKDALEFEKIFGKNPLNDFKVNFMLYQSAYRKLVGLEIDFVCFDEIQDLLTILRYKFLKQNKIKYKLGLTATPGEDKLLVTNSTVNLLLTNKADKLFEKNDTKDTYTLGFILKDLGIEDKDISEVIYSGKTSLLDIISYFQSTRPVNKITKGNLYQRYCPIVYRYEVKDAVDDRIYSNIDIEVLITELDKTKKYPFWKSGLTTEFRYYTFYDSKVKNSVFPTDKKKYGLGRSRALADLPSKVEIAKQLIQIFESKGEKTLIIGNSLKRLEEITPNLLSSKQSKIRNDSLRANFESGRVLTLASFKILQQGANLSGMDNLILHSNFVDVDKFLQRIGRARLSVKNTRIILLITKDTKEEKTLPEFLASFNERNIRVFHDKQLYLEHVKKE